MKKLLTLIILALLLMPTALKAQTINNHQWKGTQSKLSTSTQRGDVNGDGDTNITDVALTVNHILGNSCASFIEAAADLNGDGDINITDVVTLVDIILNGDDVPDLELSSTTVVVTEGSATVEIISGSGNYELSVSDPDVVDAALDGTKVVITSKVPGTMEVEVTQTTPANAPRKAPAIHHSTVTVKDTDTSQTVDINVTITEVDTLLCPDDNHPHMIDLGLPSGTKWACCNVGADKPEGYGGYYAWGETTTKKYYTMDDYQYIFFGEEGVACEDIGEYIRGTEYDVAHQEWGDLWHMPSLEEYEELIDCCSHITTTINGMEGKMFTASNGNSIFFPFAGFGRYCDGNKGNYWMDYQPWYENENMEAYALFFYDYNEEERVDILEAPKYSGYSVRPSYGNDFSLSTSFTKDGMDLIIGETVTIEITKGSGNYDVQSSDPSVATIELSGTTITISGNSKGMTEVTVTDLSSQITKRTKVTVSPLCPDDNHPHFIDLGLQSNTRWACCNIDAETPLKYGGFYAWGETEQRRNGFFWNTYLLCDGTEDTCYDLGSCISGTRYDVAHEKWGENWQMPTKEQMEELLQIHHVKATVNNVKGIKFTSSNGADLFLPATGGYQDNLYYQAGKQAEYWSGTQDPNNSSNAYVLFFLSTSFYSNGNAYCTSSLNGSRRMGHPVRPVSASATPVPHLQLSTTTLSDLPVGEEYTLEILSGSGSYTVESSN